jgi:hypothetical protein
MQYHFKTKAVNATATAAAPRVVDTHGLLQKTRISKAAKACDAADAVNGLTKLGNPTVRVAAVTWGICTSLVARALRLTPAQREAVRRGERPLVLPRDPSVPATLPTAPATPPAPLVVMGARERFTAIVDEIGIDTALALLATEKIAA